MLVRPCIQNVPGKNGELIPSRYSLHPRESGLNFVLLGPALPATLPIGKAGTKMSEWICRPTWNLSIYEIVFSLFAKSECLIQITKLIWTETSVFVKINSIRHRSENGCWHTKPPPQHPLKNTALNLILIQIPVVHCNMIYFWSDVLTDKL